MGQMFHGEHNPEHLHQNKIIFGIVRTIILFFGQYNLAIYCSVAVSLSYPYVGLVNEINDQYKQEVRYTHYWLMYGFPWNQCSYSISANYIWTKI